MKKKVTVEMWIDIEDDQPNVDNARGTILREVNQFAMYDLNEMLVDGHDLYTRVLCEPRITIEDFEYQKGK